MRLSIVLASAALALLPAQALAVPTLDGQFDVSGAPDRMTLGPDGNVWFTISGSPAGKVFGRITPDGTVTEFDSVNNTSAGGITVGSDNALWMSQSNSVLRVDPATADPANQTTGQVSIAAAGVSGRGIAAGPDSNIWANAATDIKKISTAGTVLNTYPGVAVDGHGLAAGGDGNLWIADFGGKAIVRVTTAGVPQSFSVGRDGPQEIAAGPNGQLGYSNPQNYFGRIESSGTFQETEMTGSDTFGVTFADDGAYWTGQSNQDMLGRITPTGEYTRLQMPAGSFPRYVTKGTGNTLWVGFVNTKKIGRITGVTAPPTQQPPTTTPPDLTVPLITGLGVAPVRFRQGKTATIGFRLSEAASVTLQFHRILQGRRKKGRCVPPTRRLRKKPRCKRFKSRGSITRQANAGLNAIVMPRRLRGRALGPGRYRLTVIATDAAGNRSKPARTEFTVLPKRRRR